MSNDQTLYGLPIKTVEQIQQALSGFPQIARAILYGSRAKDNFRPGSDIDLTLKLDGDEPPHLLTSLMTAVDDLDLPYSFDISLFQHIQNKYYDSIIYN